jgi:alpha-amylase/alpha-mannosidase (GH57 family)
VDRYICVHGHFYQPPRENPWLEAIELQDSAYPYHDWNERITAECYAPNAVSRILDGDNRILDLVNNYAKISFNFGPTLLSWMEHQAPEVYQAILEADRESRRKFSGHGNALAQAYNHMILPLANRRDRVTQVLWGIRDFEHRFKRKPEGMWLPETAVDLESLEVLARFGIRFAILAPHQASRVRRLGGRTWQDVSGGRIDPTMPYLQRLPSGREIAIFFYDAPVSRAVAFEGLLSRGEDLADRLLGAFRDERDWPEIVHIATDGESYGHHHRFGDMALAYALNTIESSNVASLTNYAEYLERHPPTYQVEIFENTSWSCAHGIERWRSDCGCNSGGHPGWNQAWRAPLRNALDWLRDRLAPDFEAGLKTLLKDPWSVRDDYIEMILDRSPAALGHFLARHALRKLSDGEKTTALKLLEMQRHAMLMYTSCGWFFDDLAGIEAVQVLHYAARAAQLGQEVFGDGVEAEFVERLDPAKSNLPDPGDGRAIYEKLVKPAKVDWERLGAHYGVSSLFENYPESTSIYCFDAEREDSQVFEAGKARLIIGRVRLTSEITLESSNLSFGVMHFGDHNLNGGVRKFLDDEAYRRLGAEASETFSRGDFSEVIRTLDRQFGKSTYSIRSLFTDEQRKILNLILASTMANAENLYRQIYENHVPLMRLLTDLRTPAPRALQAAAEVVLNANLRGALENEDLDLERIASLFSAAKFEGVSLDHQTLEYKFRRNIERLAERFLAEPAELLHLRRLKTASELAQRLPFSIDLWKVQNMYYRALKSAYRKMCGEAAPGDGASQSWCKTFRELGSELRVRVE